MTNPIDALNTIPDIGCTFNSSSTQPVWVGEFTDINNIISVSLVIEIRNVSETAFDDYRETVLSYDLVLFGCYEASSCSDWVEVLRMNDEDFELIDAYSSDEKQVKITLLGNTFQNQVCV